VSALAHDLRAVDVELESAQAHLVRVPAKPSRSKLKQRAIQQKESLAHARYVCRRGAGLNQRWHCAARRWIGRELDETLNLLRPATVTPFAEWVAVQIRYATLIAEGASGDPWPNCADPFDGSGASWSDTVACENGGDWLDSPGYYRCGLQFDPMWERHYGRRFCP
jgi:hypothetical protein